MTAIRLLAVVCVTYCAFGAQADRAKFVARWSEDIDAMVAGLSAWGITLDTTRGISSRGQKDFDKLYPASTFQPAIAALKTSLPKLSDAEVVLGLMRIIASAKVAHNSVAIPNSMGFEQRLPATFRWFADGLALTAAAPEYSRYAGRRVLRIGTMSPEEFTAAVSPFIAQETEVWVRLQSLRLLRLRPVLQHLQLLDSDGRLPIILEQPSGKPETVRLPLTADQTKQVNFRETLHTPVPVYASKPEGKFYWSRYLEDSRTLFVQYNHCIEDPALPMNDFAKRVAGELEASQPGRVVLDLRGNSGGNARVIQPLTSVLLSNPRSKGKLFVLIGPETFSSAMNNAVDLKQAGAILVGEPAGGKTSGYGELKILTLPNSKLQVRYTSKFFAAPGDSNKPELRPDIEAPMTLKDALAGRDAGLQAAIRAPTR